MRRIEAIQWQTRESAANMLSLQIQAACAQTQFTRTGNRVGKPVAPKGPVKQSLRCARWFYLFLWF